MPLQFRQWKITPKMLQHARGYIQGLAELVALVAGSHLETVVNLLDLPPTEDEFLDRDF